MRRDIGSPAVVWRFARRSRAACCGLALVGLVAGSGPVTAAEKGAGFYLLGGKVPLSAVLPPGGFYVQHDTVLYQGNLSGGRKLPIGGNIAANLDGTLILGAPTILWVTPVEVLGGHTALSMTVPYGYSAADARVTLGPLRGEVFDDVFTLGDPLVGASWGWQFGNLHTSLGALVNVPVGDYQEDELANIAFHRWGADVTAAATWLDAARAFEASAAVGVTFNGENPATDYTTGTELHIEGSLTKFVTPAFSIGPAGYFYQQVSGDSGPGARLGDFEGRVAALGMTAAYNFEVGETPVTARFKIYKEFATENRAEGVSGFLSISMPIGK